MKTIILAAILVLSSFACQADDDSDIVTGCLMSNAEFGADMAQICIRENQAIHAEIARYPDEVKAIVELCSRLKEMGWGVVKKCIDDDIAAVPVLEGYARDHGPLLDSCQNEYRGREASRIKICVEKAVEALELLPEEMQEQAANYLLAQARKFRALKDAIDEGMADVEAGHVVPWDLKKFLRLAREQAIFRSK